MNGFSASNIIWIKHVSYPPLEDAILREPIDFNLYFPDTNKTNPAKPRLGELILLYANIEDHKVLTLLVTPTDNIVGVNEIRPRHKIYRKVKTIAKTPRTRLIRVSETLWNDVTFGGFSQGNICRIRNISSVVARFGENPIELLENTWEEFTPFFLH